MAHGRMLDWQLLLRGSLAIDDVVNSSEQLYQFGHQLADYAAKARPPPASQQHAALVRLMADFAEKLRWSSKTLRTNTAKAIKAAQGRPAVNVQLRLEKLDQSVAAMQAVSGSAHSLRLAAADDSSDAAALVRLVLLCDCKLASVQEDYRIVKATAAIWDAAQQQEQLKKQRTGNSSSSVTKVAAMDRVQQGRIDGKIKDILKSSFWDRLQPQQLQKLLQHDVVRQHHSTHLVPNYWYNSSKPAACPRIHCSQCGECLPSGCHIAVHKCKEDRYKQLSWDDLESLAYSAESSPITDNGYCFLCSSKVAADQAHCCNSMLWRLLVVDQTQLLHSNPNSRPEVMEQTYLARVRSEGHMVVHVVFRCPPQHLPEQLSSSQMQLLGGGGSANIASMSE